jgi:hypothetical protein
MEKRLGIAQLCIMVAVLVFMALTRGSRGEGVDHALLPRLSRRSRTTSLGDDWMGRLRTGSNPIVSTGSFDSSIARRKGKTLTPPHRLSPRSLISALQRHLMMKISSFYPMLHQR